MTSVTKHRQRLYVSGVFFWGTVWKWGSWYSRFSRGGSYREVNLVLGGGTAALTNCYDISLLHVPRAKLRHETGEMFREVAHSPKRGRVWLLWCLECWLETDGPELPRPGALMLLRFSGSLDRETSAQTPETSKGCSYIMWVMNWVCWLAEDSDVCWCGCKLCCYSL